jgi:hypothetical protein
MAQHIHTACGTEIILMYETFKVTGEGFLSFGDRELLYTEGITTAGSLCCGAMECRVIHVPGFVIARHSGIVKSSGTPISDVEPICDFACREEVKRFLSGIFPSHLLVIS